MTLKRKFALIVILFRAHVINPFWHTRARRRSERNRVYNNAMVRYLMPYLPKEGSMPVKKAIKDDANEKIYSIWLQGETKAPDLIQACFRSIRKNCKQELIVLDYKTLPDFIDLPSVIIDKHRDGKIGGANFADIARVELLHEHGGFWMDATDFATAPIPEEIINEDFFIYITGERISRLNSFVQNCFIRGRKGAYLLEAWREMILEYWKKETGAIDYFQHQFMFKALVENDQRAKKLFTKMPKLDMAPTHALWWGEGGDNRFDQRVWDRLTGESFFQKTSRHDETPYVPGSFREHLVNM